MPKHTWLRHHKSAAAALHCPTKMEALQPTIFGPIQGIQLQAAECEIGGAVHFETMIWIYHGLSTGLAISAISSITWP